jgi:hypothetical protein
VLLRGEISEVSEDDVWRVGLTEVEVDESTVVLGERELEAGGRVFIWASRDEDSLHAVYVNVLDPRSPPERASHDQD